MLCVCQNGNYDIDNVCGASRVIRETGSCRSRVNVFASSARRFVIIRPLEGDVGNQKKKKIAFNHVATLATEQHKCRDFMMRHDAT